MEEKSNKVKEVVTYAINHGWQDNVTHQDISGRLLDKNYYFYFEEDEICVRSNNWDVSEWVPLTSFLLSHDFAKAVFGEKEELMNELGICNHCKGAVKLSNPSGICSHIHYPEACEVCENKNTDWKYHLQKAVIEERPIDYYYSYIANFRSSKNIWEKKKS